jgi:hypothetical protein
MTTAGHTCYPTTRRCINLAAPRFGEEAERLEERLWGNSGTKNGYHEADASPAEAT